MTNEEIHVYAQKIIKDACEFTGFPANDVGDKVSVKVRISDSGVYEFNFDFSKLLGTAADEKGGNYVTKVFEKKPGIEKTIFR